MGLRSPTPGKVALVAFIVAVASFVFWMVVTSVGPGEHGEHWTVWNNSIEIAWKVIPAALLVSILSAIVAAAFPAQTGEKSRAVGLIILLLALSFAAYVVLMLLNLRIG